MAKRYNEYYLNWNEINSIITAAKNLKESVILKILARTGMRRLNLQTLRLRMLILKGKGCLLKKAKAEMKKTQNQGQFQLMRTHYRQSNST